MDDNLESHSNEGYVKNMKDDEENCGVGLEDCYTEVVQDCTNGNNLDGKLRINTLSREEKFRLMNKKYERLIKYLRTGTHVRGLTRSQMRNVTGQVKSHIWDKSKKLLYYTATKNGRRVLVVRDENQVDGIIETAHLRSDGGHHGINVTTGIIAAKYHWNNIRIDVIDYMSKCSYCQTKNRGSCKKNRPEEGDTDNEEDEEFSQEATKALIEGIQKRYSQLSERHTRPIVYKEVQEELAQKGFYFNKERVRRKWNSLISMHKKMRREFHGANPALEYYQMIDIFHGDTDYGMQVEKGTIDCSGEVDCHSPKEEKTIFTYTKQNSRNSGSEDSPPSSQYSSKKKNEYVSPQVTTCSSAQTATNNFHQGGPFVTLPSNCFFKGKNYVSNVQGHVESNVQGHVESHQSESVLPKSKKSLFENPKTDSQKEVSSSVKTVPMVFKIVPDLTGVHGIDASQVPPITVVGALSRKNDVKQTVVGELSRKIEVKQTVVGELSRKNEVKQISNPKLILSKSLTSQTLNSKNIPSEVMKRQERLNLKTRQERLKLKTLLSIEKELKNLSKIQENILKTQEQLLNAVKSNSPGDETSGINRRQELSRPSKRLRK